MEATRRKHTNHTTVQGSNNPRETSPQACTHRISVENSNLCNKFKGKSFTLKFQQSYKSYWGNKGGRTQEENTKLSKIQIPMIPSQRRDLAWGDCRSRSSLSNPSKRCKNHWREKGIGKYFEGQQWRRECVRSSKNDLKSWGNNREEGPLLKCTQI